VSALSYYLESEGVATTGISLVREHTEQMQPPRSLWVPFPLGRPLGVPNHPAFQHRVIKAAWQLLEAPSGPVLGDFKTDAPGSAEPEQHWVCPVNFSAIGSPGTSLYDRVHREIKSLEPWYAVAVEQRGRTSVGASRLDAVQALTLVAAALDTEELNAWLWRETALAELYRAIAAKRAGSANNTLANLIASGFIPREFA